MAGALTLVVFITMGHESFYVVQQSNAIKYAPSNLTFLLLLAERMAQEMGSVLALGIVFLVLIWSFYVLIHVVLTQIGGICDDLG